MSDPGFGDIEPEDSWDPDDDLETAIDNLVRRLVLLGEEPYPGAEVTLADLDELLDRARSRPNRTPRDELRLEQIADDLDHLHRRED